MSRGLRVEGTGLVLGAWPRSSGDEAGDAREGDAHNLLVWKGRGPLNTDQGLQLGDAGGDLDEAQAQCIELDGAPDGSFRHGGAQAPHEPVGTGMEEQP